MIINEKKVMPVQFNANVSSITAKVDGSLGLRLNTPELSSEEKALIMNLQNLNLTATLKPLESENNEIYEIKTEKNDKTPSERLRNTIYVFWRQKMQEKYPDFDNFYRSYMEKIICSIKEKLEPEY